MGQTVRSVAAAAFTLLLPVAASAELARVGPSDADNGFPVWYQDDTGLALDLCLPQTDAELADGYCLILPADVPNAAALPESFPSNWSGEHFYWQAFSQGTGGGVTGSLEFALESTFGNEVPLAGDQVVFGRVRIRIDPLVAGVEYNVYTPYGIYPFTAADDGKGGGEINFTEDIGFACAAGVFDCALQSNVGPFLLPSNTAGGAEIAAHEANGRKYIADPARVGPITGSPLTTNYTLISGSTRNPNIFLLERVSDGAIIFETTDFALMGRLYEGPMPARVHIDRASYASDAAGSQIDVFATAEPSMTSRLPTQAVPSPVAPELAFFSVPCGGPVGGPATAPPIGVAVPLAENGNVRWALEHVTTVPPEICIEETIPPAPATYVAARVNDQVFVHRALYTPADRTLQVEASSSDALSIPELTLGGFGVIENSPLESGRVTVTLPTGAAAPPEHVRVFSSQGGQAELQVVTRNNETRIPLPATSVTLLANPASPEPPGTAVTFTAQGQGSPDPYEYRFWLFRNGGWEMVQDYSADNTWVLPSTTAAGSHQVSVHVRTNPAVFLDAQMVVTYVLEDPAAPASGVTLIPNLPSPQLPGTEVTFHAQGLGSTGAYEYRFWLFTNGQWEVVQDYGIGSNWTMPSSTAVGNYQVSVHVRTSSEVFVDAAAVVPYVIGEPEPVAPATGATLIPNTASPQPAGTSVQFDAQGEGGSGTYQYRFWLFRNGQWEVVQDYGVGSSWTMPTSLQAGTYDVAVHVRTDPSVFVDVQAVTTFVLE